MPLNKETSDKESLRAHHLLHRSCRGKAHGNGIAKQSNRRATISFPATSFRKPDDTEAYVEPVNATKHPSRRISRNGTSSWECSDTDSMHSSETGQNAFANDRCQSSIDRSPGNATNARKRACRGAHVSSCSSKSANSRKKENWADTLRVGSIDDRIKRMEQGWDDSNVIRTPRERKWRRITAEVEQRVPNTVTDLRILSLRGSSMKSWNGGLQKRNRCNGVQRNSKQFVDIIAWEEIVEMALAKKIGRGRGKRRRRNGEDTVDEGCERRRENDVAKGAGECMKRLEVLLQNRIPPQIEVRRYGHTLRRVTESYLLWGGLLGGGTRALKSSLQIMYQIISHPYITIFPRYHKMVLMLFKMIL